MTTEQERLYSLIDGHAAAMRAQVLDPGVKLEYFDEGEWHPSGGHISVFLFRPIGTYEKLWRRLAPVPRLIPLDWSDFMGERRVTHLRRRNMIYSVTRITPDFAGIGGGAANYGYSEMLQDGWECSRDGGATFGPCSKVEAPK